MDPLKELNIPRVINASGRMTYLGVNTLSDEVVQAMAAASLNYVEIEKMQATVGCKIAALIGAEDAMVTTGAAAGVALMVAASIAGDSLTAIQALPDARGKPNEIIIQAGHQVNFGAEIGQMIRMAGGIPHPVGAVNQVAEAHLIEAINPNAAAFLYVQSHHAVQKGMIPLARCVEICRQHNLPLLIDAAAEEDLTRYVTSGADLVAFSGGKAIGGPTSGVVAGRAKMVQTCRAQNVGIGRPMKVGKETLAGLYAAVAAYMQRDEEADRRRCSAIVDALLAGFSPFAKTERLADEAGRGIERAGIVLEPQKAKEFVSFLHKCSPPIHPRTHLITSGIVAFDPRPLAPGDVETIIAQVAAYFV